MSRLSTKQRRAVRRRRAAFWERVFARFPRFSKVGVDLARQRDETVGMLVEFGEVRVLTAAEVQAVHERMMEQDEPLRPVPVGRCPRCGVLWFTNTGFCGGCRS